MIVIASVAVSRRLKVTQSIPFIFSSAATFESAGFQSLETYNAMNWRKFVLLSCMVPCIFAASITKAQMSGHGNSPSRMGMRGPVTPRSVARMPMHRAPMPGSMGRMPMHRAPMMNSAWGLRRFNHFNNRDFNRDNPFHRFKHFNKIIFIGNFASRWWWGPWWNWNWVYPYGTYGYFNPSEYSGYGYSNYSYAYGSSDYDYGYVYPPLNYYYYGNDYSGTNYANDDEGAVRDVLAEYDVSWNSHDTTGFGRLFTEDCDYVDIDGVHWKGVQEIARRHAELFQKRSRTAVRQLTGVEVRFSTPDVALVHATWNVTGLNRPTGEAVPVLKEITTIMMVKTNGKWLITSFQNTESGD
jgi:uncharacterized protein (TIGR02246 family)